MYVNIDNLDCVTHSCSDCSWQLLYWKFLLVDRRAKIDSGQRTTSFSYLLNDKRGFIGKSLASIPPKFREVFFICGQLRASLSPFPYRLSLTIASLYRYISVCYSDRDPCRLPAIQKSSLEWCLPTPNLRSQRLEWRRILYRGLRSQVRPAN